MFPTIHGVAAASVSALAWYRAGGAPMPVAAYQPIGAASLAASYVNLANPGTFDAAPGVAPTFSVLTGWGFNGSTQYLLSGVVPDQNTSILVRYTQASATGMLIGSRTNAPLYEMSGSWSGFSTVVTYGRGSQVYVSPSLLTGILAMAGGSAYRNGAFGAALGAWSGTGGQIAIGGRNNGSQLCVCAIQAVAIYSTTLTAPQVAAVSAAMAALT